MIRKILRFIRNLIIGFFVITILLVVIFRFVPPPITVFQTYRVFEQLFDKDKEVKLRKDWVSIEKISPNLVLAVISSEDQKFETHFGFDLEAMQKAFSHNKKGKKIRGASTITQQTAKNLFLWPTRSYTRKALEVYFTFLIEVIWSKERIMEMYLNIIEMGIGVYGAEEASQYYFHKSAKNLNKDQAALIAATLPSPRKYDPKRPSSFLNNRKDWIKRQMRNLGRPDIIKSIYD